MGKISIGKLAGGLQNITFWYNCKCFGLRAYDEHSNFEVSQYETGEDEVETYLTFIE